MSKRATIVAAVIGFGLGGLVGASSYFAWPLLGYSKIVTTPNHPVWTEAQWPFPIDEWGKGKAFRCGAADCGVEVNFYIRAKIGFCNCTTGVSDDDELNRLSDFSLMGDKPSVLGAGHPIRVAWMNGRSRSYAVADSYRARTSALADSGAFLAELGRRVGYRTESQNPGSGEALRAYLVEDLQPAFAALDSPPA
jgi:hypothetical protein